MPIGEPDFEENVLHRALSPDGCLCVETRAVWDGYSAPVQSLCFIDARNNENIAVLTYTSWNGELIASGDSLILPLRCYDTYDLRLMIWSQSQTFTLHPQERPRPLAALPDEISRMRPPPAYAAPVTGGFKVFKDVLSLIGCLLFVAAAAWGFFFAPPEKNNRLIALAGMLFFGACAVAYAHDLLKLRRRPRR